jgi:hypothetical protein
MKQRLAHFANRLISARQVMTSKTFFVATTSTDRPDKIDVSHSTLDVADLRSITAYISIKIQLEYNTSNN